MTTPFAPEARFLARAVQLARRGLERVSPNPLVGAVVARGDRVLAEGWHRRFGGAHAEVHALERAQCARGGARGADLYVTLEPCGHHGKTPPCADAIVAAGVKRVIYGADDPNPATRGVGPRRLRRAGIEVLAHVLEAECRDLNAPYFHWRSTGKPWVLLKWAMSLDGKTATASGESRWITGEPARSRVHALRRRVDAVLVGTRTALLDDPLLTPRPARGRAPLRVVLDRRGVLPLGLRLLSPEDSPVGPPRLYVTGAGVSRARLKELARRGVETLVLPATRDGIDLEALLGALGARGVCQLLVEGGGALAGRFLEAGEAHEVFAFIAPRLVGGVGARGPLGGSGLRRLVETPWLLAARVERLGRDVLIQGRVEGPG